MGNLKEKAIFAASVLAVIAAVAYIQRKHTAIPLVGDYLPK